MARLSEQLVLNYTCINTTVNNGTTASTGISMATHRRLAYQLYPAVIPTSGALAWVAQESADNSTFYSITGKTAAHTDTEDRTVKTIEINSSELTNGRPYVRLLVYESGSVTVHVVSTIVMEKDY